MVLMNIEGALADMGCTAVSAAATIDEALALLETERFDVAMLDVNLGGQSSYRIADALALRSVPFVFSTGYGEHGIDARFGDRPVLRSLIATSNWALPVPKLSPVGRVIAPKRQ